MEGGSLISRQCWLPYLPTTLVLFAQILRSISGNPYSNIAWDMWIECTMNKGSKMKSGWLSLLQNEKQLLVHSRNVNNVGRIRAALNDKANRKAPKRNYVECSPSRMRVDEQCVQNVVACLQEFDAYSFDPASPTLRTLQTGLPASNELVASFSSPHALGEEKVNTFLQERVYSKNTSIHAPISLTKCLTFAKEASPSKAGENNKAKEVKWNKKPLRQS